MMSVFEVAIVGAGIVGASLFSELTRNGVKCVLLEASCDVSNGSTKANSGIVHSGYDPEPNTLKAKFNLRGNAMYPSICSRLRVPIKQCGTLTVAPQSSRSALDELLERGVQNGVPGLRIIEREELHKMEPNLADNIDIALYAPTGAVISPYLVCIALCEEGVLNGGTVLCNFEVDKIKLNKNEYVLSAGEESVKAKFVVNCAGVNSNKINALVGAPQVPLDFVKGEYLLLDKSQADLVQRPIFPLPTQAGKGILATPTLHNNVMLGPTAIPCEPDDTSVDATGIQQIKEKIILSVKQPNYKKTIKLFAGVRVISGNDFILERFSASPRYYYAAGICSPGLTAAPAIAEYLQDMLVSDGLKTKKIDAVLRKPYTSTENMSKSELKSLIKKDSSYGKIVCRCEHITEGEIIEALNSPLKPYTVDGIKRRVRPTMGRCQGGFCLPKLIKLIAAQKGIEPSEVTLHGKGSNILIGKIK